jgi:phytoene dehydrogenase-like protein
MSGAEKGRDEGMRALIIGAGANELVAAHYLARAGHPVLVLEGHTAFEGMAGEMGWIPPRIVNDLGLEKQGLVIRRPDPWASVPLPQGGRLDLWRDPARSMDAIRKLSPRDAAKWPAFCERMVRLAGVLERMYLAPPPDLLSRDLRGLARLAGIGLMLRRLGRTTIEDFLRVLPMPVADWLDDWFESDVLKGVLGAAGVMHLCRGPRSGGTAFLMLHHHVGNPAGVFRAARSNLCEVLRKHPSVEVRAGAEVAQIVVRAGRATGVVLADGEEIPASFVVSGLDPRRTLLELADPGWLDPELVRAMGHIRRRGAVALVTLALDREPAFQALVVAPSLDYLERACDDAKYGHVSRAPYLEAVSKEPASDGRHRLEVHVQYAPYALAEGTWDDARRRTLGDLAVEALARHAPELKEAEIERVLSPRDLETVYGWPEGQAYHAEPALDQMLWMRPHPVLAHYRTPIDGLYLCGPGTHPGGASGCAGYNAAREILRDLRAGRLSMNAAR